MNQNQPEIKDISIEMTSDQKTFYDPHSHRLLKNPTTDRESIILLLRGCIGTGFLAMPEAFAQSGILVGTILTVVLGVLVTYCIHILIKSQYEMCKWLRVPVMNYPETMYTALQHGPPIFRPFSKISGPVVDFFLLLYQLGMCSVYIVFISQNVKQVLDQFYVIDLRILMFTFFVPILLTCYIRNLKLIAPFSQVANGLMLISIAMLMFFILRNLPPLTSVPLAGSSAGLVRFFTTTLFALSAIGVVVSVERNMATPSSFRKPFGVLNISMTIVILIYTSIGFFGFLKYGEAVEGSISLNLPQKEILAQALKCSFSLSIFLTFALQFYVAVEILCSNYLKSMMEESNNPVIFEYSLRTFLVVCTYCAALAIPMLDLFICLIGALSLSSLGILFPPIIETCVLYSQNSLTIFNIIKNTILAFVGLMGLLIGTYLSVADIVSRLSESHGSSVQR